MEVWTGEEKGQRAVTRPQGAIERSQPGTGFSTAVPDSSSGTGNTLGNRVLIV